MLLCNSIINSILNNMKLCLLALSLAFLSFGPRTLAAPDSSDSAAQLLYSRAFEVALWAMPATDSFATREAVVRDLKGKPNDVAINTKPMDSDIHLVAL